MKQLAASRIFGKLSPEDLELVASADSKPRAPSTLDDTTPHSGHSAPNR